MKNPRLFLRIAVICLIGISSLAFPSTAAKATTGIGPNAWSRLEINYDELYLSVCAGNLYSNTLKVYAHRTTSSGSFRQWKYSVSPSGALTEAIEGDGRTWYDISRHIRVNRWRNNSGTPCYTLYNIEGSGPTLRGVPYYTLAWLNDESSPWGNEGSQLSSCYAASGGIQLCDTKTRW